MPTVDIITMGCSKNLVDSERLIAMFEKAGYKAEHNPDKVKADVVVVNTCGFIGDAKQESIDMILQCCQSKKRKKGRKVFVMGCLSQRYADDLPAEIPEVDGWYGKFDWDKIIDDLKPKSEKSEPSETSERSENSEESQPSDSWARSLTTAPHHAYLKVAEGCNRFCAFCAIPIITGRYKSRPIDEIVEEAEALVRGGVKELNVLAQDLSAYGQDIYGRLAIAELVERLAAIDGLRWIRLHYAYPAQFPYDLLPVMAKHDKVCKYLDIALQHISDPVLANMRRHIDGAGTRELLRRIRAEVPGIHLRTTLMVGFPGEGEKEFAELMEFVHEQRFERMGAFAYCEEDDTYAAKHFADDIPDEVKQDRLGRIMAIQEGISEEINAAKVGTRMLVVVDSLDGEYYRARTQYDSPDVDNEVLLPAADGDLTIGEYYIVEITDAMPFDLIGRVISRG